MTASTIFQDRLKAIRTQTARAVTTEWDKLPDHHKTVAEPFAAKILPIVTAGQLLAANTTNSYIARQASVTPIRIQPEQVTGRAARNIDPLEEYQRPFGATWGALGEGQDLTDAIEVGRTRLGLLVVTDVWLAMRAATDLIDQANQRITGWVRVADASACDLCSAADGMPMNQAADLAGHPGCGCTSEAQITDSPPTEAADPEAIDVHQHDELGPVLYQAGQSFAAA